MRFLKILVILFCSNISIATMGQHIGNIAMVLDDEIIIINYDLIDSEQVSNTYDLQIFASHDGFESPLTLVTGDIGNEIELGTSKTITWEAKKEIGDFKGQLFVEIRGVVTPPFLVIVSPTNGSKFKPTKTMLIRWVDSKNQQIDINLYKDNIRVSIINQGNSQGSTNWAIPKATEKGIYHLEFTRSGNNSKVIRSNDFLIAKGMPIWVLVAGVAVVGGVTGIVLIEKPPEKNNDIPDPIKPSH